MINGQGLGVTVTDHRRRNRFQPGLRRPRGVGAARAPARAEAAEQGSGTFRCMIPEVDSRTRGRLRSGFGRHGWRFPRSKDMERAVLAALTLHFDGTAHQRDQPLADGQAQTRSLA